MRERSDVGFKEAPTTYVRGDCTNTPGATVAPVLFANQLLQAGKTYELVHQVLNASY